MVKCEIFSPMFRLFAVSVTVLIFSTCSLRVECSSVLGASQLPAVKEVAENYKAEANNLFAHKRFHEALDLYSAAIQTDPDNPIYLCNRAFAHIKLENYGQAVSDAEASLKLNPTFVKAFYRRGTAYLALGKTRQALADFRTVARLRPSDPTAQGKVKQCEKIARLEAFEDAIRMEKTASPYDTLDIESIEVEPEYDGPQWEGEITEEFVVQMIEMFKNDKRLHRKYAYKILVVAGEQLKKMNNVVELEIPEGSEMTVCGDTHGQFYDLLQIFSMNGNPSPTNPYIFNGDFVDRGSWSLEVIMTLLAYKCLYPESIHLTRGNHETIAMNKMYGFEGEVIAKHNRHMYECFVELFWYLPLAITLNGKVFVCHGGLFRDDRVTLADINKVDRAIEPGDAGIVCDLLWSDPQNEEGRAESKRGTGCMFGPDVTKKWLEENNLSLLVRSHEMKEEGYEVQHDGKCITIFSAPNYCDQMGNLGAYIRFGHDCEPRFTQFAAAPHPPMKPMKYAPVGMMPGFM